MTDQLKTQAVSGVKWNAVAMLTLAGLQFVTLTVLARLLTPSDFGLMGMIMVVIGFMQTFADMGLSEAIIQRQDVAESHLSSFFWINVFLGMLLFVGIVAIKPFAVSYFKNPALSQYLIVAALIFLITPFGQIFTTLLKKELRFKTLSKIEMAGAVVSSASQIGLAGAHFGVFSLILGQLINSLLMVGSLFFIFRKTWLPRFHFNLTEIKSYFAFGAFQLGRRVVLYLSANVDYLIIGRFLGPEALGLYTLAYQLITFPVTKINPILTKVTFPAFSKIQHDHANMIKGYCKVLNYIALLSFPMLAGMAVVAPEFIRLVYGPPWEPAIRVVQIFCLVGIFKALGNPVGSIILAKGRADIGFYWNVFVVTMVSVAVMVGVHWGITGVAVAILILQLPLFFLFQPILNKLIGFKLRQYFEAIKIPSVCSVSMLAGIIPLKMLLGDLDELPRLLITVASGVMLYLGSYYLQDKMIFVELKSLLK